SQGNHRLFAAMQLKGLSPEQLINSVNMAVRPAVDVSRGQPGFVQQQFNSMAFELRSKFANYADKRTEYQTSILQALALMNGKLTNDATSLMRSNTLVAAIDSPFMDTEAKLNSLFLATVSRKMRPDETSRLVRYVEGGGPS